MRTGDEITIEPSELVAGGDALARVDGFPIFAGNVYPGDVALVRLTEVKKGFARAELVRIERASPLRRAALGLDAQLAAKKRILAESLRRIGKFDAWPPIALHVSPLNYRLRSRLHADGDAVGFYAMSLRAQGAGGGGARGDSRENTPRPAPAPLPASGHSRANARSSAWRRRSIRLPGRRGRSTGVSSSASFRCSATRFRPARSFR